MPRSTELRERAGQALQRAREIMTRESESDEPLSSDDVAAHAAALREAGELTTQADEMDERVAAALLAETTLSESRQRAATPAGRQGRSLIGDVDHDGFPMPHTDANNTRNGRHQYSITRAINGKLAQLEGRGRMNGLELETHQELEKKRGVPAGGVLVPWDVPMNYRGGQIQQRMLDTGTGAGAAPTLVAPTMIDILRARLVLAKLGATVITGYSQPFSLPKTTSTVTVGDVTTEGTNTSETSPEIGDIDFTYKSMETTTKLTRQFLHSANLDGEAYVIDQITKATALKLQNESFNGPGTSKRVKGLFKYTSGDGINVLALATDGANPTWKQITSMTGMIDTANAPDENRSWLFNPTTVSYFQSLPKETGYPVYILGDSGMVAGYPYASTSQVPNNLTKGAGTGLSAAAFAAWSEMLIALFSGADLYLDTMSMQPHVRVTIAQDYDVQIAHLASFATCVDLKTV